MQLMFQRDIEVLRRSAPVTGVPKVDSGPPYQADTTKRTSERARLLPETVLPFAQFNAQARTSRSHSRYKFEAQPRKVTLAPQCFPNVIS